MYIFSKKLFAPALCGECTQSLTFENFCQTPVFHHHPDGTVHAHVRGEELHSHAPDGIFVFCFVFLCAGKRCIRTYIHMYKRYIDDIYCIAVRKEGEGAGGKMMQRLEAELNALDPVGNSVKVEGKGVEMGRAGGVEEIEWSWNSLMCW